MDTLSSMANIGGYKGVLLAAVELNRYFPMLTTAAGMVFPAKVFVIGAGVAGLQAIATAKRLGANVVATDVRPEVKEQIESVGAKYVGIELKESAAAGGGYAKELSEEDRRRQSELLAAGMRPVRRRHHDGADRRRVRAAADLGRHGEDDEARLGDRRPRRRRRRQLRAVASRARRSHVGGVTILAPLNLPATMPFHASLLFSRNLTAFVQAFTKDKAFGSISSDDIQQGARHHARRRGRSTREPRRR